MRAESRINLPLVLSALLLLLAGAGAWWLYNNVESYEVEGEQRFSAKAQRDPYLAADYFLRDMKVTAQRDSLIKQLNHLPPKGTVVLTAPSNLLSEKQAEALLDWLYDGGHLIVIAGSDSDSKPDPLLAPFGISREFKFFPLDNDEKSAEDKADEKKSATSKGGDEEKLSEQLRRLNRDIESGKLKDIVEQKKTEDLTAVELDRNPQPLQIAFEPSTFLHHNAFSSDDDADDDSASPFYWAESNGRVHLAQFESGDGLLTVVSDLDFWTSAQIGKHDHALALLQLVYTDNGVSLIADADMPPLTKILWQWAREFWIALLLLAVVWVWHRARRFGPITDPHTQIRRSLAEHILASATYLWRGGKHDELIDAARRTVLQRAQQRFADFAALEPEQQAALLHSETGVDAAAIRRALFDESGRDTQVFRDRVGVLQQLNFHLTHR